MINKIRKQYVEKMSKAGLSIVKVYESSVNEEWETSVGYDTDKNGNDVFQVLWYRCGTGSGCVSVSQELYSSRDEKDAYVFLASEFYHTDMPCTIKLSNGEYVDFE